MSRAAAALLAACALAACGPTTSAPPQPAAPPGSGRIYPMAPPTPEFLQAPNVPTLPGFSSAVKIGQTIYLAGQVPLDSTGLLVGEGDRVAQLKRALGNATAIVRFARGVPADLVKLTVYCVGCTRDDFDAIRIAASGIFPIGEGAALTMIGVAALPEPDMLVAVDGIAVLRGTIPDRTRDPAAAPH
jgi:enamine deaminase RidA (YjgF/YER057c/UK114 family)